MHIMNRPHALVKKGLSQVCGAQASHSVIVMGKKTMLSANCVAVNSFLKGMSPSKDTMYTQALPSLLNTLRLALDLLRHIPA